MQDNPFLGVTLTPNLTSNLGLFLPLRWVVFTLFGVSLTLKVEQENFRYGITPFLGLFYLNQYRGSFLILRKGSLDSVFGVKITPL